VISAVLDTNVICSGLLTPNGVPGRILRYWRSGAFDLVTSEPAVAELQRILGYRKIRTRLPTSVAELEEVFRLLAENEVKEPPELRIDELTDQTDLKFIEAAAAAEADYLVTGDSAVLRLGEYGGTRIVTARRFLTILELEPQP